MNYLGLPCHHSKRKVVPSLSLQRPEKGTRLNLVFKMTFENAQRKRITGWNNRDSEHQIP